MNELTKLEQSIKALYLEHKAALLFHGWHHINFVRNKSKVFAQAEGIQSMLIEAAALTHDLNYIVEKNSEPDKGQKIRFQHLQEAGFVKDDIQKIETIIIGSHTATRDENISIEAKVLSDADTLFKALPITPIIFAGKYIQESGVNVAQLAEKICDEQQPLMNKDIYFYTNSARSKYMKWAKTNLELWQNIQESLIDEDIKLLLSQTKE